MELNRKTAKTIKRESRFQKMDERKKVMELKKWALAQDDTELSQEDCLHPLNRGNRVNLTGSGTDGMVKNSANRVFGIDWGFDPRDRTRFAKLIGEENDR